MGIFCGFPTFVLRCWISLSSLHKIALQWTCIPIRRPENFLHQILSGTKLILIIFLFRNAIYWTNKAVIVFCEQKGPMFPEKLLIWWCVRSEITITNLEIWWRHLALEPPLLEESNAMWNIKRPGQYMGYASKNKGSSWKERI